MTKLRNIMLAGALGSAIISSGAQAACWTPAEVDAAKIRDLQSRLMVAALRCARSSHDLLPEYNRFVRNKKPLLQLGNNVLKNHFAKGQNRRQAVRSYDRYAVSLANKYGAGSGDLSECKTMKTIATSAADSAPTSPALVQIAQRNALSPLLPGGRCGIVMAAN